MVSPAGRVAVCRCRRAPLDGETVAGELNSEGAKGNKPDLGC